MKFAIFIVVNKKDVQFVDWSLLSFVLRKNDMDKNMFLHWVADKDDLIYDLIEHNPESMTEFKRRLSFK